MWKQSGRVSLWRYTENERNYSGWNLNADGPGCASLLALLDALASDHAAYRTIALTDPTEAELRVPNNKSGRAAWVAPAKLRIAFSSHPSEWVFSSGLDPAVLVMGGDWLEPLREGITGIARGRGDHSIGNSRDGNLSLWFWWSVGPRSSPAGSISRR